MESSADGKQKKAGSHQCYICHERRAALKRPKTLEQICKECFYKVFEEKIHQVIVKKQLFKLGERITLGASGGKNSTVLASIFTMETWPPPNQNEKAPNFIKTHAFSLTPDPNMAPHLGLIPILIFSLSVLSSLSFSLSNFAPTVFDILPEYSLPRCLLPSSVSNYTLSDDGRFIVILPKTCYIQFNYLVYYENTITGKLTYGAIINLKGIQVQRFLFWFDTDEIRINLSPSDSIYFTVGIINKKLDEEERLLSSCVGSGQKWDSSFFFSIILSVARMVALSLLPILVKNTYISENALMPGSVASMLSNQEVVEASRLLNDLTSSNSKSLGSTISSRIWYPINRFRTTQFKPGFWTRRKSMEQQRQITIKRIAYLLDGGVFKGWLTDKEVDAEL